MRSDDTFKRHHIALAALAACARLRARRAPAAAAGNADEAAIRGNVRQMEDGWNAKSGAAVSQKPSRADAEYVVINGKMYIKGREAIAAGHQPHLRTPSTGVNPSASLVST